MCNESKDCDGINIMKLKVSDHIVAGSSHWYILMFHNSDMSGVVRILG